MTIRTITSVPGHRPFNPTRFAAFAGGATIANLAVYFVAKLADASMTIDSPAYSNISWQMAGLATMIALALGGLGTWVMAQKSTGFTRKARLVGLCVALISMISPFVVADNTQTALALATMHLLGGFAWYSGLQSPERQ